MPTITPNHHVRTIAIAAVIGASLSGCATQQGNQQLMGAGVGCIAGGIVGGLIAGRSGAALGCAAGSMLGVGAVAISQYNAEQARTKQADANHYRKVDPDFYGLSRSATETAVKIRTSSTSPTSIKPGGAVTATTYYSIITPKGVNDVAVDESWLLKKDGEEIADLTQEGQIRQSGGWSTETEFNVPKGAEPGTYVVEHKVQTGSSYNTAVSVFVVN